MRDKSLTINETMFISLTISFILKILKLYIHGLFGYVWLSLIMSRLHGLPNGDQIWGGLEHRTWISYKKNSSWVESHPKFHNMESSLFASRVQYIFFIENEISYIFKWTLKSEYNGNNIPILIRIFLIKW